MSEFTQGKWYVIQGAGIDELDVISEDKRNICYLFGYSFSRWNEQKANARLIAAAPEMYELLYEALQELKGYDPIGNGISTIYPDIEELLARIDGDSQEVNS